jgi:hypothetical protein
MGRVRFRMELCIKLVPREINAGVKNVEHGEAKNSVKSNIVPERKGESGGLSGKIVVGHEVEDNGAEIAVGRALVVVEVMDGTTKLDWFKGVRFVAGNILGSKEVGVLSHEPLMEWQVAHGKGATSIHNAAQGRARGSDEAKIKCEVWEAIVDGNWHGWNGGTVGNGGGWVTFHNLDEEAGLFDVGVRGCKIGNWGGRRNTGEKWQGLGWGCGNGGSDTNISLRGWCVSNSREGNKGLGWR